MIYITDRLQAIFNLAHKHYYIINDRYLTSPLYISCCRRIAWRAARAIADACMLCCNVCWTCATQYSARVDFIFYLFIHFAGWASERSRFTSIIVFFMIFVSVTR